MNRADQTGIPGIYCQGEQVRKEEAHYRTQGRETYSSWRSNLASSPASKHGGSCCMQFRGSGFSLKTAVDGSSEVKTYQKGGIATVK